MANHFYLLGPSEIIALIAATVWQLSSAKQTFLNGHHKWPSLAAFGHGSDSNALGFGASHALWCLASCWSLMLLPFVFGTGQAAGRNVALDLGRTIRWTVEAIVAYAPAHNRHSDNQ